MLQGSVIALGYVDFTTGAPTHALDAALEQLHTNGATNYAESKLPAKWGWLLNFSMGQNKTELLQDNAADVQIHTMNYPPGQGPAGPPPGMKLSMTATIAIAVGSIVAVLAGCCIIFIWRRRKAKKERERERERQVKVVQQRGSGKDSRASGYLHDLDGMTGVDDSISGKTGTIKVRSTCESEAALCAWASTNTHRFFLRRLPHSWHRGEGHGRKARLGQRVSGQPSCQRPVRFQFFNIPNCVLLDTVCTACGGSTPHT